MGVAYVEKRSVVFLIVAVLWGSFVYMSDYKNTKADTSVSPEFCVMDSCELGFLLFPYTHIG